MRIYSKKAYKFDKDGQESVAVAAGAFSGVLPDWISATKLFQLALKEDSIRILANKKDEDDFEKDLGNGELAALKEQAKSLGIKNYAAMKKPTLENKIAEALKKLEDDKGLGDGDNE